MVVIATAAVQMMGILVSTAGGTWRPFLVTSSHHGTRDLV